MEELRLGVVESQFAEIIWSNEPLPSGELVKLCEQKLGWKKSTTYTVLKRLCERGIFQNEKGMVSVPVACFISLCLGKKFFRSNIFILYRIAKKD